LKTHNTIDADVNIQYMYMTTSTYKFYNNENKEKTVFMM